MCLSNSAVVFLLLRLSQGAMLAGVFVSSYIASMYSKNIYNNFPTCSVFTLPAELIKDFSGGLENEQHVLLHTQQLTSLFILQTTFGFLHFT